jgi:type 1 glutamine amidotransferase
MPVLIGTPQSGATTPPQPVAWTRSYGPNQARIFYTSLGAPEDMKIADVRKLLLNAVAWTLAK